MFDFSRYMAMAYVTWKVRAVCHYMPRYYFIADTLSDTIIIPLTTTSSTLKCSAIYIH